MKLQLALAILIIAGASTPSWAHHSFAAEYDSTTAPECDLCAVRTGH